MSNPNEPPLVAPSDQVVITLDGADETDVIVFVLEDGTRVCTRVVRDPIQRLALVKELLPEELMPSLISAAQQSLGPGSGPREAKPSKWLERVIKTETLDGISPEELLARLAQLLSVEAKIRGGPQDMPNVGSEVRVVIPRFAGDGTPRFASLSVHYTFGSVVRKVTPSSFRTELIRAASTWPL